MSWELPDVGGFSQLKHCMLSSPLLSRDHHKQGLLLLRPLGGLQLVHGGQVEEHALVQVVLRVLLPKPVLSLLVHRGMVVCHCSCISTFT